MLNKYIKWIKRGNILLIPFDTVWGLATDATNNIAVKKIFLIKKRPLSKPISVLMPNAKYSRGNFTYLIKYKEKPQLCPLCFSDINNFVVGERLIEKKYLIQKICVAYGRPLTATSANLSNATAIINYLDAQNFYQLIPECYKKNVMLVNSKINMSGKPSQIIDLTGDKPKKN
ncbi:hypothetical protein CO101_00115 [Candidatus Berkelbacteria bacterium CG_4_9_14_3_um_filter_39_23]|uniref:L-threonylcarbamoyladenylate synthase n=2 Tax=Candidatus Berkelbacteria TaxID=1618330 RepID=A0A2M7CHF1_9BACT|nr:hypothetical protein [Candidatus Berkelbacteria bacterium]OIP05727.1 MAG: hypothetical protein AUK14_01225 [Candidatus Berkelbacteria bacterium CG2_30_39_44]PIR28148.1 MAG: hypothetical protein COV39_00680 [Candidatus Berkelbacteria bacterium CG11_big_fil_rev_8_21_14_0_20_40_23]PIV25059.1 MAG: hypothetical protein COS38_03705 [Candidatus Berkelbacteria bacterium CG03_land_8_20_14_0_80_40_36]PIX30631.1 MAG: hypothetical protein COZ62_01635 [Candidatus Berkelbacteria bacterium CG_4_8_14_3_um_f